VLKKFLAFSTWKQIVLLLLCFFIAFFAWSIYDMYTEEPMNFFPLDDKNAEYKITKNCPYGQGWEEKPQTTTHAYCLEYRGTHVVEMYEGKHTNFFSITIGKSKMNLEPYLGKKVKNIKGKYWDSTKQCIQDTCIAIGGPYIVVNIDHLELAE